MDRKQRSKWRLESMRRSARCSFLVLADRDVNEAPESLFFPACPSLPFGASVKALSKIARILHGARRWPQPEGRMEEALASERDSVFDYDGASHESWRFFALRHRVPLRHFVASVRMQQEEAGSAA